MTTIIIAEETNCGGESIATQYFVKELKKKFFISTFPLEGILKTNFFDFFLWHIQTFFYSLKKTISLSRRNPDKIILYSTSYLPGLSAIILNKFKILNLKTCFHYHGNRIPDYPQTNFGLIKRGSQLFKYKFVKTLHQYLVNNSDLLIFTSESSKKTFFNNFSKSLLNNSIIVPNGVNVNKFTPCTDHKKKILKKEFEINSKQVVSLVGSLNSRKNLLIFLNSLKFLKNQDTTYIIAFPKPKNEFENVYLQKVNKYLSENLIKKTQIRLFQDYPQIEHIYQVSNCSVIISSREEFPLCLLESLACGTPVITSTQGLARNLVQKEISKKLIVHHLSSVNLAKKINTFFMMKSPELNSIIDKSIKVSNKFTWEKSAKLLIKELSLI